MTVVDLVDKLRASQYRADAVARVIGYVVMIQRLGWDGLKVTRMARHNIEKTFKSLGVDPFSVEL